ncbi:hypothetical protein GCM10009536_32130 [Streptomyces thermocarboxydus]
MMTGAASGMRPTDHHTGRHPMSLADVTDVHPGRHPTSTQEALRLPPGRHPTPTQEALRLPPGRHPTPTPDVTRRPPYEGKRTSPPPVLGSGPRESQPRVLRSKTGPHQWSASPPRPLATRASGAKDDK